MTQLIQLLFLLIVTLFLSLPHLQRQFQFFKDYPLAGVEEKTTYPKLSIRSWCEGNFQKQFDGWFSENVGLRTQMIRTENEINFSLFGDISSRSPSRLVVGHDNYLFERNYIQFATHPTIIPKQDLKQLASRIIDLKNHLQKRGIAFLGIISPNKAIAYQDKLPADFGMVNPESARNRRILRELLEEGGVYVLDGSNFLDELRLNRVTPIFPKSGTHWSYAASCYVADEIVRLLELQGTEKYRRLGCDKSEIATQPRAHDKDLAELMNLWHKARFYEPLPYPLSYAAVTEKTVRPPAIFIGSSFMWPVLHYFNKHRTFEPHEFLYYFSRRFTYNPRREFPVDKENFDWQSIVFSKKAVVIEVNETGVGEFGFGFVDAALRALSASNQERPQ